MLGERKDRYFIEQLHQDGIESYPSAVALDVRDLFLEGALLTREELVLVTDDAHHPCGL